MVFDLETKKGALGKSKQTGGQRVCHVPFDLGATNPPHHVIKNLPRQTDHYVPLDMEPCSTVLHSGKNLPG